MPFAGQTIRALDFAPPVYVETGANENDFSNTDWSPGNTVCGISFIAPTSGLGTVSWFCRFGSIHATTATNANVSIHVRTGAVINAGATISLPTEDTSLENPAAGTDSIDNRLAAGAFRHLTGLVAGSAYNAVIEFQVASGTATIFHRSLLWTPSP